MKVLFLGKEDSILLHRLVVYGEQVIQTSCEIDGYFLDENSVDFIVSYGYKYIIDKKVVRKYWRKAINIHLSFLPWNRGVDSLLWALIEGAPIGVTIHYIDEGVDTGDILIQKEVKLSEEEYTLASAYQKLEKIAVQVFMKHWPKIRKRRCKARKQSGQESFHKISDKDAFSEYLNGCWNWPIARITSLRKKLGY